MKNVLIILFFCATGISCLFAQKKSVSCISKFSESVKFVAWSTDIDYFAVSADNSIVLFNAKTNEIVKLYMGKGAEESFVSIKLSDDGKFLLGIRADGRAFVWNVDDDKRFDEINLGGTAILDAVFLENGYRIAVLGADNTIYEWFKLLETNVVLQNKRAKLDTKIQFLSISDAKNLFSVEADGSLLCIDTKNWNLHILRSIKLESDFPLQFNAEKNQFLGKISKSELVIMDTDGKKLASIFDRNEFLDTAVFVADKKNVVAGTKKSQVKTYNKKNGEVENTLSLVKGDNALCIASGANGDIIVGTEQGYLMRMRQDGAVYSNDAKGYVPQDWQGEKKGDGETDDEAESEPNGKSVDVLFAYGTLPENYYIGSVGLEVVYRNRNSWEHIVRGAYWGASMLADVGIPKDDFPYNYRAQGQNLNPPYAYALSLLVCAGYERAISDSDFRVFAEARAGGSMRILYNNSLKYAHTGSIFTNFLGEAVLGARWNMFVLSLGAAYDSNLGILKRCALGVSIGR